MVLTLVVRRTMAESKYAVTNMMREDYEPFKKYCNDHDIVIKQALAEATKMWLDSKLQKQKETI
jgi:hypothetical protein